MTPSTSRGNRRTWPNNCAVQLIISSKGCKKRERCQEWRSTAYTPRWLTDPGWRQLWGKRPLAVKSPRKRIVRSRCWCTAFSSWPVGLSERVWSHSGCFCEWSKLRYLYSVWYTLKSNSKTRCESCPTKQTANNASCCEANKIIVVASPNQWH